MTIVMALVEKHNGRIEVESKEGIGTTVKLYFPFLNSLAEDAVV